MIEKRLHKHQLVGDMHYVCKWPLNKRRKKHHGVGFHGDSSILHSVENVLCVSLEYILSCEGKLTLLSGTYPRSSQNQNINTLPISGPFRIMTLFL